MEMHASYLAIQQFHTCLFILPMTKGQLISKRPFGVIVWTKIPTKNLTNSALESKKW
jgi:hypothetical protein